MPQGNQSHLCRPNLVSWGDCFGILIKKMYMHVDWKWNIFVYHAFFTKSQNLIAACECFIVWLFHCYSEPSINSKSYRRKAQHKNIVSLFKALICRIDPYPSISVITSTALLSNCYLAKYESFDG